MTQNKAFRSLTALLIALLMVVMIVPVTALAADDAAAADTTVADTTAADTTAADTTAADDDTTDDEEKDGLGLGFWISMGVLGALIIVGIVFAIIKREKLKVWWLSYKSELKKIVWSSKDQVKKNTIVVVVVVLSIAIVIGLLDFAFSKGIIALGNLF